MKRVSAGKPPVFNSPEELQEKINAYFEWCLGEKDTNPDHAGEYTRLPEPLTITGLAIYIGFESRQSIYDYEKHEEYSYIIKAARLKVENGYEKRLYSQSPAGPIFALKNMGWTDRQEITHEGIGVGFLNIDPLSDDTPDNSTKENITP